MPRVFSLFAALALALAIAAHGRPALALDWVTVGGDGKFSVQMPGPPTEDQENVDTELGRVQLHMYSSSAGEEAVYMIVYTDFAGEGIGAKTPQQFLHDAEAGAVRNTKATLRSSQEIALGRWPGRAFVADAPGGLVYASHMFLVGNRLYQLMAATRKPIVGGPESTRFFDSFKVNDN